MGVEPGEALTLQLVAEAGVVSGLAEQHELVGQSLVAASGSGIAVQAGLGVGASGEADGGHRGSFGSRFTFPSSVPYFLTIGKIYVHKVAVRGSALSPPAPVASQPGAWVRRW